MNTLKQGTNLTENALKKGAFLVVLGGGESGVGAAILGKQEGHKILVSDKGNIEKKYKEILVEKEIEFEENQHTETEILKASLVVKSPGIPDTIALIKKIKNNGINVVSEIEFASWFTDAKIVGITGSNGKTTTALMTYHILKNGKKSVGIAGNIGDSFAKQVSENKFENYVLELSSFQLDGIEKFKPHVAVITNITPDHLDRYDNDFNKYVTSKFRITMNQKETDYLVYDADDGAINNWLQTNKTAAKLVPFSVEKKLKYGAYLEDKNIITIINKENFMTPLSKLSTKGKHNTKNAMVATLASQLLNIRNASIKESLSTFEGAEHRLEKVAKINGVEFINDSKATNVNATYYALDCIKKTIVWIVGGVDKGNDYKDLLPLVREKVSVIICLGIDNEKIISMFGNVVDTIVETESAKEAVMAAKKMAFNGETVLLSPACASFDLFKNYEDRGNQFKKEVLNM